MDSEMHTRSFLLLRRDLVYLQNNPLLGIDARPIEDANPYRWVAKISGVKDTAWDGGIFQLRLTFTDQYNSCPPVVHFMTIPFHPNINPDNGLPSLHLLKGGWDEDCNVSRLLLALQSLLSNPDLEDDSILNPAALKLYRESPHTYKQLVLDCVTASHRVDAGLPPYNIDQEKDSDRDGATTRSSLSTSSSRRTRSHYKRMKQISFDDYHILWKGLATSVSDYSSDNQYAKLLNSDRTLRQAHTDFEQSTQSELEQKMKQHVILKYGRAAVPTAKQRTLLSEENRQKRVAALSSIYKLGRANTDIADSDDEVDALVEWTNKLDDADLVS